MTERGHTDQETSPSRRRLFLGVGAFALTSGTAAASGFAVGRARYRQPPDEAKAVFDKRADEIRFQQQRQSLDTIKQLRRKYMDPVFGKARVWEMIEKLGMCIDESDNSLLLTSQYVHVQQILEAMEQDKVEDRDLILTALLHDIGKVMLLANEAPEHVVGYINPVGDWAHGIGLDNIVFQFGHDEFAYQRLKDHVPENIAWTIRYHSGMYNKIAPYCSDREKPFLNGTLARFQPYDMGVKSFTHLPKLDMSRYRDMIEDMFPQPILF